MILRRISPLAPDTAPCEVKNGPYAAADDKDFAPWAPRPETDAARAFLEALAARFVRRFSSAG